MDDTPDIFSVVRRHRGSRGDVPALAGAAEFSDGAAVHQRFQLANFQAGNLAAAGQPAAPDAGKLPDVSRSLENAAGRMEKAFSNAKTIVLLKD